MTRIARGIYRDAYGFRVVWQDAGHSREKRFPADAPLEVLKAFRARQVHQAQALAQGERRGSFVRDVVRFLKARKQRPCFKSDRAHLRPWVQRFAGRSRWHLTHDGCAQAVEQWRATGYSPREIRHRVRLLIALFRFCDGPTCATPCDGLELPRLVKTRPIAVSAATVRAVALELRKHEIRRWLRDAKTRARYLVLATTGQRPAQVMRAHPLDLDWDQRVWYVRPAKGDAGSILPLNDDMVAAWQLFVQAHAWGRYDTRSFAKTLRRCGWPAGIRPYALRHTVGLTLSQLGVDLGDIQAHMGHQNVNTTRQFYVPALPARQRAASARIDHRVGPWGLELPRSAAKARAEQKGKGLRKSRHLRSAADRAETDRARGSTRKSG